MPVTDMGDSIVGPSMRPARRRSTTTSTASRKWPSPPAAPTRRTRPAACSSNMVLKKGLNAAARQHAATTSRTTALQDVNISPELAAALGNTTGKGNRTDKYQDYGFDLGGPLLQGLGLGLGHDGPDRHRPADADRRRRQHVVHELRVQGRRQAERRRSAATSPSTRTTRTRTAAAPARPARRKPRGTRPGRPRFYKGEGNFVVGTRACSRRRRARTSTAASC